MVSVRKTRHQRRFSKRGGAGRARWPPCGVNPSAFWPRSRSASRWWARRRARSPAPRSHPPGAAVPARRSWADTRSESRSSPWSPYLLPVAGAGRAGAQVARPARRRALRARSCRARSGAVVADASAGVAADRQLQRHPAPLRGPDDLHEARLSREELQELVEEAAKTGALDERSSEIASRAIAVRASSRLRTSMVPRNRMVRPAAARRPPDNAPLPPRGAALAHARLRRVAGQHRRVRHREGSLRVAWEGRSSSSRTSCGPIQFIETTPAAQLLEFMQRERQRIAVVSTSTAPSPGW